MTLTLGRTENKDAGAWEEGVVVEKVREVAPGLVGCVEGGGGAEEKGREFRVVLIREGLAKSGRYFTRRAVEEIAAAAEGLRAFADHTTPTEDRERPVRSVRDVVGFYREGRTTEMDGRAQAEATLRVFESNEWLAAMAREVLGAQVPAEVIGLSIDAECALRPGTPPGMDRQVVIVERLIELRSVDVVTRASAGGGFVAVKESQMEDDSMENGGVQTEQAETSVLEEAQRVLAEVQEGQFRMAAGRVLEEHLVSANGLPDASRTKLRRQLAPDGSRYAGVEAYVQIVEAAIAEEAELVTALRAAARAELELAGEVYGSSGLVRGLGDERPVVTVAGAERQQLVAQIAMDRLFGLDGQDGGGGEDADWRRARELGLVAGLPRWGGIREAYAQLTGDPLVSGVIHAEASIVREANEVTSGVLNQALLNSMTKRLVRDYRGQEQTWRKFCTVVPVANFKSQDRVRLLDFNSLSTVAEGAAYTNLAWDDSREAYVPAKRGNLVVVTREAILNDDLRSITRIPPKLARAAYITINEFVYGLFTGNPVMNDSTKVFDDGVQTAHGNRGTSVLSSSALQAAITTMMKQTDSAGKRLNLQPAYLLVPADLLFTALTIVNSTLTPGTANNDKNVLEGAVKPISVAQFTDATDWYLICDPMDIESIEVGFVGGKEEPELLQQNAPLLGQVFTNDQMSFKVRWEFGGGWLDYRGAFWSQAAG